MSSCGRNGVVVGISSRSSETDLKWLMDFISSEFKDLVSDVKYLPITNKNRYEWEEEVMKCQVGILYHTKHRGRTNIVDVDGALYDEELIYLSNTLGKHKVMVLLDDLENASEGERQRILEKQPSIQRLSSQFLIFTEHNKSEAASRRRTEFSVLIDSTIQSLERKASGTSQVADDNRQKPLKPALPTRQNVQPPKPTSGQLISPEYPFMKEKTELDYRLNPCFNLTDSSTMGCNRETNIYVTCSDVYECLSQDNTDDLWEPEPILENRLEAFMLDLSITPKPQPPPQKSGQHKTLGLMDESTEWVSGDRSNDFWELPNFRTMSSIVQSDSYMRSPHGNGSFSLDDTDDSWNQEPELNDNRLKCFMPPLSSEQMDQRPQPKLGPPTSPRIPFMDEMTERFFSGNRSNGRCDLTYSSTMSSNKELAPMMRYSNPSHPDEHGSFSQINKGDSGEPQYNKFMHRAEGEKVNANVMEELKKKLQERNRAV